VLPFVDDPAVIGSGGPNLPVTWAGTTARAVALSPGNPVEVLTRPDRAEHVAGCNSAFRREALLASGGYLPVLTSAGDDVDVCWRMLDQGGTVAFSAAAQVRHERRSSVRGYLRQQRGYGRAERMISGRHPHRFNRWGHATWTSSVYGGPLDLPRLLPRVIAYGSAGSAPYQPVVGRRGAGALQLAGLLVLPTTVLGALALLLAAVWTPALLAAALAGTALASYATAVGLGTDVGHDESAPVRVRCLTALLHLLQPLARAWGGLRARPLPGLPTANRSGDRQGWVDSLHVALAGQRCHVRRGGPHDRFDLRASAGPLLSCRLTTGLRWEARRCSPPGSARGPRSSARWCWPCCSPYRSCSPRPPWCSSWASSWRSCAVGCPGPSRRRGRSRRPAPGAPALERPPHEACLP
jgi:hypothetical protein